MTRFLRQICVGSAILCYATSASAELSAEDVWGDWKSYVSGFGYEVSGVEERAGDILTVTGVTFSSTGAAIAGGASISIDRIELQEQPDGTVVVDLPALMPIEMTAPNETGGVTRISMDYRQSGMELIASGAPDTINYNYSVDTITLETTGIEMNGQIMPDGTNDVEVTVQDVTGTSTMALDSLRRYVQSVQAGSLSYTFNATDIARNATSVISGQMQQLTFDGTGAMPLREVDSTDLDAMLGAGFAAGGTFEYAANALSAEVESQQTTVASTVISGPGSLGVTMDQSGLSYDVAQSDLDVEVTSGEFPLPVNFSVSSSSFQLAIPVRQSSEPEDFSMGFALNGLAMSDVLWGLFDPSSQLPRDPATVAVDLAGKARLMFNLLDPASVANLSPDAAPAEIETLDINKLQISAAGAELAGDGGFTFDTAEGQVPKPQGSVDLKLTGGNGLIDKLIAAGLIQDQEAMGIRMMMGLLAVPGEAPDTLNSKIEINAEGHVIANGQRIQ